LALYYKNIILELKEPDIAINRIDLIYLVKHYIELVLTYKSLERLSRSLKFKIHVILKVLCFWEHLLNKDIYM